MLGVMPVVPGIGEEVRIGFLAGIPVPTPWMGLLPTGFSPAAITFMFTTMAESTTMVNAMIRMTAIFNANLFTFIPNRMDLN